MTVQHFGQYETYEAWIEDRFWTFDFEWRDGRVHPHQYRRGGEIADPQDYRSEADYLESEAYRMMAERRADEEEK